MVHTLIEAVEFSFLHHSVDLGSWLLQNRLPGSRSRSRSDCSGQHYWSAHWVVEVCNFVDALGLPLYIKLDVVERS